MITTEKIVTVPPTKNKSKIPRLVVWIFLPPVYPKALLGDALLDWYKAIKCLISSKVYHPLCMETVSLSISTKTPIFNELSSKIFTNK